MGWGVHSIFVAGAAAAASSTVSRDQVRAELMEAQRNGTLVADGQTGATFRQIRSN